MSAETDKIHKELGRLFAVSSRLDILAEAFHITGNQEICDKLESDALEVESVRKNLSEWYSEHLSNEYQEAQRRSATVLEAALAGAELSK